jgi:transposase-like protein
MIAGWGACPTCGLAATRKDGRDRRGHQVYECKRCRRRFTELTGTPFAGHRFPPDVIAVAVRWYLRFRLSYVEVAELLTDRGVHVDQSTVHAWVQKFTPLYDEAARAHRSSVGCRWSVDETYVRVAGAWCYVYRAIDEHGQVVDVFVSEHRAAEDAATFFRRAIAKTGIIPTTVTTDRAATYPPALAEALPAAEHQTGKLVQQRIERDHGHLKGRLRPTRGFGTLAGARVLCGGHALVRNLIGGFHRLGAAMTDALIPQPPQLVRAWDELTAALLVG